MAHPPREELIRTVATMRRGQLVRSLREMHCPFRLDFTDEYLAGVSLERLRHIVLAAALHDCDE